MVPFLFVHPIILAQNVICFCVFVRIPDPPYMQNMA
jgi:hypothetical protein